jgi:hypothetical protein
MQKIVESTRTNRCDVACQQAGALQIKPQWGSAMTVVALGVAALVPFPEWRMAILTVLGAGAQIRHGLTPGLVLLCGVLYVLGAYPLVCMRIAIRSLYTVVYLTLIDLYVRLAFRIREREARRDPGLVSHPLASACHSEDRRDQKILVVQP